MKHSVNGMSLSKSGQKLLDLNGSGRQLWQQRQHLLDVDSLQDSELEILLEAARVCREMVDNQEPPLALLQSVTIANLFYENSTRTRSSFELASRRLGATVLNLDIASSSVAKGETIEDTAVTLWSMGVNALVQRHHASGSAEQVAKAMGTRLKLINAGDGWHAHPTQALLDYFTMHQIRGSLNGAKIAIIGDITHSRVARSNIALLTKMGASVHVAGPPTLLPANLDRLNVKVYDRIEPCIADADFIMILRLQLERQKQGLIPSTSEYKKIYQIDSAKLSAASPNVRILHPGPMNRDIEISNELADNPKYSLISTQVRNGIAVRMAILYLLLSGKETN